MSTKSAVPAVAVGLALALLGVAPAAAAPAPSSAVVGAAAAHAKPKPASSGLVDLGVEECAQDVNDLGVVVTDTHLVVLGRVRPLPGGLETAAEINNLGMIAGSVGGVAALWNGRRTITIGVVPGDSYSYVTGMNELGEVVGTSGTFGGATHAFKWSRGVLTALPGLGGDTGASEINNLGQVAGYAWEGTGTQRPVKWERNGRLVRLGALGDGTGSSQATSINDRGETVGYHYLSAGSGDVRVVRWDRVGKVADVTPAGGQFGVPVDINTSGRIIGSILPAGASQQGFVLDRRGAPRYLPPAEAGATGILASVNERGWAVGCVLTDTTTRAVLWRG